MPTFFFKTMCSVTLALIAFSLSGCATLRHENNIKTECKTSRMLITDLTQTANSRSAQLPSGEMCPRETV
jgi:hypothetical protein